MFALDLLRFFDYYTHQYFTNTLLSLTKKGLSRDSALLGEVQSYQLVNVFYWVNDIRPTRDVITKVIFVVMWTLKLEQNN